MDEYQAEADKLQHEADGEEARHGMPLPSHRVHLQRDEHRVDQDEDQIHLERVLVVVRELERQRNKRRLVGIAVDQPEVVLDVWHTGHVEAARVKVVPVAGCGVAVAGDQGHIPESARNRSCTLETISVIFTSLVS